MQRSAIDNGVYALYLSYFEQLATEHVDIAHNPADLSTSAFIGPDGDVVAAMRSMKAQRFMWITPPDMDGYDVRADNEMLMITASIAILEKVSNKVYADISAAKNRCQEICLDIVARMLHDKERTENQLLSHFTRSDFKIEPGQAENADAYYGAFLTVTLKTIINLEYNPAKFS
jgi:hypothetical protein